MCLSPMPPVRTCPQVVLAVPAFLLQRAPPCPAPPSSFFELSHQWSSRSIASHVGEDCDKVSQALQPWCSTFDVLPRSFLHFIFLFLLPLLRTWLSQNFYRWSGVFFLRVPLYPCMEEHSHSSWSLLLGLDLLLRSWNITRCSFTLPWDLLLVLPTEVLKLFWSMRSKGKREAKKDEQWGRITHQVEVLDKKMSSWTECCRTGRLGGLAWKFRCHTAPFFQHTWDFHPFSEVPDNMSLWVSF